MSLKDSKAIDMKFKITRWNIETWNSDVYYTADWIWPQITHIFGIDLLCLSIHLPEKKMIGNFENL